MNIASAAWLPETERGEGRGKIERKNVKMEKKNDDEGDAGDFRNPTLGFREDNDNNDDRQNADKPKIAAHKSHASH